MRMRDCASDLCSLDREKHTTGTNFQSVLGETVLFSKHLSQGNCDWKVPDYSHTNYLFIRHTCNLIRTEGEHMSEFYQSINKFFDTGSHFYIYQSKAVDP